MKAPIRVGIPPGLRDVYIERWPAEQSYVYNFDIGKAEVSAPKVAGYWLLPIHVNKDRTLGTFLKLYDNGMIERVTRRETEGDEVVIIKPKDQ